MNNFRETANFIWSVADLLRGDYKQAEYGKVILPLTVLRRLDCVLEPKKEKVLKKLKSLGKQKEEILDRILNREAGYNFHNHSLYNFSKLVDDPNHIAANLRNFINGFSKSARDIIKYFKFEDQIKKLDEANLLYKVIKKFQEINLHPDIISNLTMGYIFEELIRKFAELSNETAGEHFTPREVIRLMVDVLFVEDSDVLTKPGIVKTIYDPACGTGGMLSIAEEYIKELNPKAHMELFGQELNDESFAICKSDILIKGQNADNIKYGNSFTKDGLPTEKFDYMLSNPPYGVEWKKVADEIKAEHEDKGFGGRFGAGLPRINDGSLLFLLHMVSKMKPSNGGTRMGIVFNGSPLFTGSAGSGESDIRKWVIENDMLETIIALPDQLFYNTGISTYIWIVTNRKTKKRKGKVQLINAVSFFKKMTRSLGNKRNEISNEHISEIVNLYTDFEEAEYCKIFDNTDFGYHRITVERPLRLNFQTTQERIDKLWMQTAFDHLKLGFKGKKFEIKVTEEGKKLQYDIIKAIKLIPEDKLFKNREKFVKTLNEVFEQANIKLTGQVIKAILNALSEKDETADICTDKDGNPEPDPDLRDYENIPLKDNIQRYFEAEVLPHVPDAWIDHTKTKIGYEINFTRYFYKYQPLRSLVEIRADIIKLENETEGMIKEIID
ncbi:MAG: SAM-dependent DNA methyltransferase [Ignavibacteria bacterium]|nr:SAM-dependent DNA methyltransferase [Ignavibacteria bacterium]